MNELVGFRGTVTVAIRPPRPGEVCLSCKGGVQRILAYATEEVPRDHQVVVYDVRPNGVDVEKID